MKKNNFMRIASVLMVLTLLSTCAISGTFAKYVTSDSSSDQARVAKWGVTLSAANSSNFKTEYDKTDSSYTGTLSVQSSASPADNVVAPGTSGEAITFAISGTPEVATKIDIKMTITSDIVVPKGTYADGTATDASNFTSDADYYPVVFTLKQTKAAGSTVDVTLATGNLTTIQTKLEEYTKTAYYAPNTDIGAEFTLSWEWLFDNVEKGVKKEWADKADTLLGNAAVTPVNGVKTEIEYKIDFTVTQVD